MPENKTYIAIDLKSFYASVECVERGLDPLNTNLTVADESRTEKTICLAVSPSLKAVGVGGRCRLFELIQAVQKINNQRKWKAPNRKFTGKSYVASELQANPALELDYIVAPPQMAKYMEISTKIYQIYLRHVSAEDIHVYSIDEVFIDATDYLPMYKLNAHDFAMKLIREVLAETGITATAGIGTNMYLAKVAMDIVAKKMPADKDGVRIASLNEMTYREKLWEHRPLTDFWRVGNGYATKLEERGIFTMGDIALLSEKKEDMFYQMFGVNAELLIDHAWGYEPTTIAEIKAYKPESNSLSQGQVLSRPYPYKQAKTIVHEMMDLLSLDLVKKRLVTNQVVLEVGYDTDNAGYKGEFTLDRYGRKIPKHAHGTENLPRYTSSTKLLTDAVLRLFDRIINKDLNVRRVYITVCKLMMEDEAKRMESNRGIQMSLFDAPLETQQHEQEQLEKERRIQETIIEIRQKYGNNAFLTGTNFDEGATTRERNGQIGGHKAAVTKNIEVRVCNEADMEQVYKIRETVFINEQKVPEEIELDELDSTATHIVCLMNGKAVGCGRYFKKGKVGHLGRVAVLKEYRKKGIGSRICGFIVGLAMKDRCDYVEINSQLHAVPFYKKLEFIPVGDVFIEAGIEHIKMARKLK